VRPDELAAPSAAPSAVAGRGSPACAPSAAAAVAGSGALESGSSAAPAACRQAACCQACPRACHVSFENRRSREVCGHALLKWRRCTWAQCRRLSALVRAACLILAGGSFAQCVAGSCWMQSSFNCEQDGQTFAVSSHKPPPSNQEEMRVGGVIQGVHAGVTYAMVLGAQILRMRLSPPDTCLDRARQSVHLLPHLYA